MPRLGILEILFQRDDTEEVRLRKLRQLAQHVRELDRINQQVTNVTEETTTEDLSMTGPAVLGRLNGTGAPNSLTSAEVTEFLQLFSAGAKGLVPAPGTASGNKFLRDDGAWATISGAGGALEDPGSEIGLTMVPGTSTRGMRSDGAPALSQAITPVWTGVHQFTLHTLFADGTETVPSITFTNDLDTGIYWGADNPIVFAQDDDFLYTVVDGSTAASNPEFIEPDFDDSAWSVGPGPFGGPSTVANTAISPQIGRAIWLRKHFVLNGPYAGGDIVCTIQHDDGGWCWFNGVEVPVPGVSAVEEITIPGELVRVGDNVLVYRVIDGVPSGSALNIGCSIGGASSNVDSGGIAVTTSGALRWDANETRVRQSVPMRIDHADGLALFDEFTSFFGANSTEVYSTVPNHGADGTAAAPTWSFDGDTDTGLYSAAANQLGVATDGTLRLTVSTSAITGLLPWRGENGSAASPTFSFSSDTGTGIFRNATNELGFSAGGITHMTLTSTRLGLNVPIRQTDGDATAPAVSFTSDTDTGVYRVGDDQLGFSAGGLRLTISDTALIATLPYRGAAGVNTAPSVSASGDTDTGMYFPSANTLAFATGGQLRFGLGPDGELLDASGGAGTAGQVPTSGGAGIPWAWGSGGGGGGSGGALAYVNEAVPAGNTVANTVTETAFASTYDITANSLAAGSVVRVRLFGVYSTTGTPTIRLRLKLDATTYVDTTAVVTPSGAANSGWSAEAQLVVHSAGATGEIDAQAWAQIAPDVISLPNTATITTDTTQDLSVTVTAEWGTADAANTITLREMAIWVEQAATPLGAAPASATYLTEDDETASLPNSRQLLAGANITFDDSVAGARTISSSGGGGGLSPGTRHDYFDDFIAGVGSTTGIIWDEIVNGGTVSYNSNSEDNPGQAILTTGTVLDSHAQISLSTNIANTSANRHYLLGTTELVFEALVQVPDIPATGARFGGFFGLVDGSSRSNIIQGSVMWDTVSSSQRWILWTRDGGVTTSTPASFGATAGTWHHVRLVMTAAQVDLYVDGVLAASNTTNIPTTALSPGFGCFQNTSGGAVRQMRVDCVWMHKTFATPRSTHFTS